MCRATSVKRYNTERSDHARLLRDGNRLKEVEAEDSERGTMPTC